MTPLEQRLARFAFSQGAIPSLLGALGGGGQDTTRALLEAAALESQRRLSHQAQAQNPYLARIEDLGTRWWQGVQGRAGEFAHGIVNLPGELGQLVDPAYMATIKPPDLKQGLEVAMNFMMPAAGLTTQPLGAVSQQLRARVADISERLSQVRNRLEAIDIISETGDIADPQMRRVIGNAFKDAWERFSHVPLEQQRVAHELISRGQAPTAAPAPFPVDARGRPYTQATLIGRKNPAGVQSWRVGGQLDSPIKPREFSSYEGARDYIRSLGFEVPETAARPPPGRTTLVRAIHPQALAASRAELGQAPAPAVKPSATPAQQKKAETLFKGIAAKHTPELPTFQFGGKTASTDIMELAQHHSTGKNPIRARWEDPSTIRIQNERTGGYLKIYDADKSYPYIRSTKAESEGVEQAGGKQMYQTAMSWIANTGKKLDPDPGGISTINKLRKIENTISSYLRHGREGYIDLSNATTARTLKELLVESRNMVFGKRRDLEEHFYFDGETFRRAADGAPVGKGELNAAIEKRDPKYAQGIGETTLKRALMTKWALTASLKDVLVAARKFKEPLFYGLGALAVSRGEEREGR
jgi:hypothetical protein